MVAIFWLDFFLCDLLSQCVVGCMSVGFVDDCHDVSVGEAGIEDVDSLPMMQFCEEDAIPDVSQAFEGRYAEIGVVLV